MPDPPGPDRLITIEPNPNRVVVRLGGRTIADTIRALSLREAGMAPVRYLPREDADMTVFRRTARTTHCPYKGDASYFTVEADGSVAENAVWSYEEPHPAVAAIKGHLAFYPDRGFEVAEQERPPAA